MTDDTLRSGEDSAEEALSTWADEVEYGHIKLEYSNRKALMSEAINKANSFRKLPPDDPLYHRLAVSAEMARMRVHMAYILNENKKLTQMVATVGWLHDQMSILQGAYAHVKMLAETARIDYGLIAKGISAIAKLKEELSNGIKQESNGPNGPEGEILPHQGGREGPAGAAP